jgi:hypothetical protein
MSFRRSLVWITWCTYTFASFHVPCMAWILPPELVREIIARISEACSLYETTPQWFIDLSLVARAWLHPTHAVLFAHLTLESPSRRPRLLERLAFVADRPHLATHVTSLCILRLTETPAPREMRTLAALPRVTRVEIQEWKGHLALGAVREVLLRGIPGAADVYINCRFCRCELDGAVFYPALALRMFTVRGMPGHVNVLLAQLLNTASAHTLRGLNIELATLVYPNGIVAALEFTGLQTLNLNATRVMEGNSWPSTSPHPLPETRIVERAAVPASRTHTHLAQLTLRIRASLADVVLVLRALFASWTMPALRVLHVACDDVQWESVDGMQPVLPLSVAAGLDELKLRFAAEPVPAREELAALFGVPADCVQSCIE